ncbi:MAG: ATP-binding protein [Oscillospiraceae bacterium]|nr:ATP-binding protein [Oscillospiraceae bacterium]
MPQNHKTGRMPMQPVMPQPERASVPSPLPQSQPKLSAQQNRPREILMNESQLRQLQFYMNSANMYVSSRHLEMLSPVRNPNALYHTKVLPLSTEKKEITEVRVYRICQIMYQEEENSFEKLATVYSALNSFGCITAMILHSDGIRTDLYLCTRPSSAGEIAGSILTMNLKGQFPGCKIETLSAPEISALMRKCTLQSLPANRKTVRSVSMIPSRREAEVQHDKSFSAQGYEKFIDAMQKQKYTLVVLSQPVSPQALDETVSGLENLYTCFSAYAKESATYAESESDAVNFNLSTSIGHSVSDSISHSFGTAHTNSISYGRSGNNGIGFAISDVHFNLGGGSSWNTGNASTVSRGQVQGNVQTEQLGNVSGSGNTFTSGKNLSLTVTRDNKAVANMLMRIDEHLKRIQTSQTFGMWNCACYLITEDIASATIGTSTLSALFSGDSASAPRAYYNQWDGAEEQELNHVLDWIGSLQHPEIELEFYQENEKKERVSVMCQKVVPAMMVSGKEIPILMGLPRKSVSGVAVDHMAEFGRNISEIWRRNVKRPIPFGEIYHMGESDEVPVYLNLDSFASHLFICGASGSGKSNTTYHLLEELIQHGVPFLVIEPAKGEYKKEFAGLKNINIFTADETSHRTLRINPFEFHGIHIREHLDKITEVICACWPLYGPMPGMLKQALEEAYISHGWDLEHSERIVNRGSIFPVFKDLESALERIIENSPYSKQSKGDYKGALLNRVSSLSNGFAGQIFGHSSGISEQVLFNQNTIVDLSSIGAGETRGLIMGILIIKLRNFRKFVSSAPNSPLVHVTVLEEAHHILKRCSKEQTADAGNIQGTAVEGICQCIAEMRSSGEGFMIIDQSPSAVDETAIKNTAIKIAMRLPAKDDCEIIGASLSLEENQIRELSRLPVGMSAVYHVGWTDTVLAKMGDVWDNRYRKTDPQELSAVSYARLQGVLLQMVYKNILYRTTENMMHDMAEAVKFLCTVSSRNGRPTLSLPEAKSQELLNDIQIFMNENGKFLKTCTPREAMNCFGEFAFQFLKLESVFRICRLNRVTGKMLLPSETLSEKEKMTVLQWEKELRNAVMRYLIMPETCDPSGAYRWPQKVSDAEYFWPVYGKILSCYAQRLETHRLYECRYSNAVEFLISRKHFEPVNPSRK